jgi:predicted DNA-binding transcriptional regulator AlpA
MSNAILTEKEAAIYIGMSRSFLGQDRMNGYREGRTPGPVFMKLGRSIRYRKEDLDTWLTQHRVVRSLPY